MDIYSKGSTPKLNSPGDNYYYEGATSYKAADISSTKAAVEKELSNLESDLTTQITDFQKKIEELDNSFGEKFIKINNKKLGFVDVEAYTTLATKLKTSIEESVSDSNSFFSTCSSEITNINQWLAKLESNYAAYQSAVSSYQSYAGKTDENAASQAAYYKGIMDQYKQLSGDPTSHGEWIKE